MAKDSLKKLLSKFPYFLDKRENSNFYKSQDVTNKRFQDISQSLFEVDESFSLLKKIWIWKEQEVPYDYTINFLCNCHNLKSVIIYKNDELLYMEAYSSDDKINSFIYSYEGSSYNEDDEATIIPKDTFKMVVETYDEYSLSKGFPENDERLGDEYDHDYSIDRIGRLNNIPRKKYIATEDYANTEPPYNDRLTEDDYHYLNRIINYNLRLHDTPLPILEIWKEYGIEAQMVNRESNLIKMFDENLHDEGWIPKPWEHKDSFCDLSEDLGKFFFVSANTISPLKNQSILFNFKFLNSFAEPITGDFYIDIYLDGDLIEENYSSSQFRINSDMLDDSDENVFEFIAKEGLIAFSNEEIRINILGCNDANFYVSNTGNDNNDGRTRETAFASIQKAVNSINNEENFIVILGENTISSPVKISQSCKILGCNNAIVENTAVQNFFSLSQNQKLELQDLCLVYDNIATEISSEIFENQNRQKNNNLLVRINSNLEE